MPSAIFVERVEDLTEQIVALAQREFAEVGYGVVVQERGGGAAGLKPLGGFGGEGEGEQRQRRNTGVSPLRRQVRRLRSR